MNDCRNCARLEAKVERLLDDGEAAEREVDRLRKGTDTLLDRAEAAEAERERYKAVIDLARNVAAYHEFHWRKHPASFIPENEFLKALATLKAGDG